MTVSAPHNPRYISFRDASTGSLGQSNGVYLVLIFSTLFAVTLVARPADATPPPGELSLQAPSALATRIDRFDDAATINFNANTVPTYSGNAHLAVVGESSEKAAPIWPRRYDPYLRLRPPTAFATPAPSRSLSWFEQSAWGLAGAGVSLLSGALYFQQESADLQRDYDALPHHTSAQRYREVQRQIDDARYLVLALYAAGGTVIAESIILLTDESEDPTQTRAEIAPTWRNGGPAAYLRVSF